MLVATGSEISATTDELGYFTITNIFGNTTYDVLITADSHNSHNEIITTDNTNYNFGDILLWERGLPVNNVLAIDNDTNVMITWDPPGSISNDWFSFTNQNILANSIGVDRASVMIKAHRYTSEQLQSLGIAGAELTKVQFVPRQLNRIISTTVQIYVNGSGAPLNPGELIYSQKVNIPLIENWVDVVLNRPVTIPVFGEMWIAVEYVVFGGTPLGADSGPAFHGHGNVYYHPSWGWGYMSDGAPNLNYNWAIRGFVSGAHIRNGELRSPHEVVNGVHRYDGETPLVQSRTGELRSPHEVVNGVHRYDGVPPLIQSRTDGVPPSIHHPNSIDSPPVNIYRVTYENAYNQSNWQPIATNISGNEYEDLTWSAINQGAFYYIVEPIYAGNNIGNPRFSNLITLNISTPVTFNIETTDNGALSGGIIKLVNHNGDPSLVYQQNFNSSEIFFPDVWHGYYTLTISHPNYMTQQINSLIIQTTPFTHEITLVASQIVIDEDFQSPPFPPPGWVMIDADGDGLCWMLTDWQSGPHTPPPTEWYIASESAWYYFGWIPVTPDNYFITNSFSIPERGSALVSYKVGTISPEFPIETYSILISTNGQQENLSSYTTVFTETIDTTFAIWKDREILISGYHGENVHIALRHHDSTDNHLIGFTNFKVAVAPGPPIVSNSDKPIVMNTELFANYPNPFNPSTSISFNLKESGNVNIDIFNIRGQKVITLVDDFYTAGVHVVEWKGLDFNGKEVSSGVYFYKMNTPNFTQTKRMVLIK